MTDTSGGFRTPGQMLRRAREARGLSVADLARQTKIPPRQLASLEADDYGCLSGDLYVRSFLRTCAEKLGLPAHELLAAYEHLNAEAAGDEPAPTWETETEVVHVRGVPWRTLGRAAAVVVVVLLAVLVASRIARNGGGGPRSEPVAGAGVEAGAPAAGGLPVAAEDDSTALAAPAESRPEAQTDEPPESEGTVTPPARDVPSVPESAAPEVALEPPVGDPALVFADGRRRALVLRVLSDGPISVAVAVDGTTLEQAAAPPAGADRPVPVAGIVPGRVYTVGGRRVAYWGGDDYFYLKLDSVAGVTVTLNGRAVAVPASAVGREWEITAATAGL